MARRDVPEQRSILDSYQRLGLEELRPLGALVAPDPPTRKQDLAPFLAEAMTREDVVRRLHEALDDAGRAAVQEATHDPAGRVDRVRFRAGYGRLPDFGTAKAPTLLRLFLPRDWQLPAELHAHLRSFVPPPRAVALATIEDLPATVPLRLPTWGRRPEDDVEVPLRIRTTAPAAGREVRAVLRLIEAGKVRVSDKTRRPIPPKSVTVRMFLDGELDDTLDFTVFAETQAEPERSSRQEDWLRSLGGPPILTDTAGKLGDDPFEREMSRIGLRGLPDEAGQPGQGFQVQPPDGDVEGGGERHPGQVRGQQDGPEPINPSERQQGRQDGHPEHHNLTGRQT
jgi:hypothetical protein